MATITFHANGHKAQYSTAYDTDPSLINHTSGSGIGFFGGGFGISVPVAQYQDSSYVTNSDGTSSGIKINNMNPFKAVFQKNANLFNWVCFVYRFIFNFTM